MRLSEEQIIGFLRRRRPSSSPDESTYLTNTTLYNFSAIQHHNVPYLTHHHQLSATDRRTPCAITRKTGGT